RAGADHSWGGPPPKSCAGDAGAPTPGPLDPAPFRGILPVPASSIKASAAVLSNPANRGRAIALTFDQFRYGWAHAVDEEEAHQLYDPYLVVASAVPIFQAVAGNLDPVSRT